MPTSSKTRIQRISVDEAHRRQNNLVFVDCRGATALSRNPSQVRGAIHASEKDLRKALKRLPRNRTIVPYCT